MVAVVPGKLFACQHLRDDKMKALLSLQAVGIADLGLFAATIHDSSTRGNKHSCAHDSLMVSSKAELLVLRAAVLGLHHQRTSNVFEVGRTTSTRRDNGLLEKFRS